MDEFDVVKQFDDACASKRPGHLPSLIAVARQMPSRCAEDLLRSIQAAKSRGFRRSELLRLCSGLGHTESAIGRALGELSNRGHVVLEGDMVQPTVEGLTCRLRAYDWEPMRVQKVGPREDQDFQPRPWVLLWLALRAAITLFVAAGGVGKSKLMALLAVMAAAGREVIGIQPIGQLRVLIHDSEETPEDIRA